MRLSLISLLLCISVSLGDTRLSGPTSAKKGELVTITIQTDEELIDPQLTPFSSNNAKVLSEYRLLKDPKTNELLIILFTSTPDRYSFTLSSAVKITVDGKESVKTIVRNHVVEVINDNSPLPPGPVPSPNSNDLEKALQAAFAADTSANKPDQLKALTTVITNVRAASAAGTFVNFGQVQTALKENSDNLLKADTLRPMRTAIATFLINELGRDARAFNKDKVNAALDAIVVSLAKVKG